MNDQPLISVILPVYNAEKYIQASVESILQQSYSNFELLILNDGSTDGSEALIQAFKDPRIRYFSHQNRGLAKTLNAGIALSIGSIIARQDADDISLPTRFEEQVRFLNQHPNVMLLGTRAQLMDEKGNLKNTFHEHPTQSAELKTDLLFNNPFVHSSVMIRKEILNRTGEYTAEIFEDYTLWSAIAAISEVGNLPRNLVLYREVATGISQRATAYNKVVYNQSLLNCLPYIAKGQEQDLKNLLAIFHNCYAEIAGTTSFRKLQTLFNKIISEFSKKNKLSLAEMNAHKHFVRFQRCYFSYKIDSGLFPAPVQLFYKIKRRILLNQQEQ